MVSPKCREMEGEVKSLIKVWLFFLASLCYCYFVSSRIPKGFLRFLSLSPIFYLFTILPLQLSTVLPTGVTAFFIIWLTNFKLLLFTFGWGSLPSNSLPQFLSFACLPIRVTQKQTNPSNQSPFKFYLIFPIKALLLSLMLIGLNLYDHKQKLHPTIIIGLYCCLVYLLVDVVLGLCIVVINVALGIELDLPSDEPYFSTSLRDFWGRRWNLMVTHLLRHTVFIPVRSLVSKTVLGPKWASVSGVMASFLVSGLMHELLFFYATRATPTWEVTCFFLLHGVCTVVEFSVKKWLGHKWRLHRAVSGPITLAFVIATAAWLFFPPLLRGGVDERTIKEFNNVVDCVIGSFGSPKYA